MLTFLRREMLGATGVFLPRKDKENLRLTHKSSPVSRDPASRTGRHPSVLNRLKQEVYSVGYTGERPRSSATERPSEPEARERGRRRFPGRRKDLGIWWRGRGRDVRCGWETQTPKLGTCAQEVTGVPVLKVGRGRTVGGSGRWKKSPSTAHL